MRAELAEIRAALREAENWPRVEIMGNFDAYLAAKKRMSDALAMLKVIEERLGTLLDIEDGDQVLVMHECPRVDYENAIRPKHGCVWCGPNVESDGL